MATLVIRDLDDDVKARLRVQAAQHGRSMEAEVRAIITNAVSGPSEAEGFLEAILDRFGELGGVDLDLPARGTRTRAAEFRQ
jgi:plasmid stability protein